MKMCTRIKYTNRLFSSAVFKYIQIQQSETFFSWRKISNAYNKLFTRSAKPPYKHVCQLGDPVLRCKAEPVQIEKINSDEIQTVIAQMTEVSKKYQAVGLSAPQIGIPLRIFIMGVPNHYLKVHPKEIQTVREMMPFPRKVFINPEMKIINPIKVIFSESCESLRGYSASVPRYHEVEIFGLDEKGENHSWRVKGWPARIAQHELDHLEGRMYIDIMDMKTYQYDFWYSVNIKNGKHVQYFIK